MADGIERERLDRLILRYRETRRAAAEAEEQLFAYLWQPLLRFVRSRTDQEATNLAASVVARFMGGLDDSEFENSKAYLFQITRHRVFEEWRRRRHRPSAVDPAEFDRESRDREPVPEEVILRDQEAALRDFIAEHLRELMDSLPEGDREILRLCWVEERGEDEAAARAGVSLAVVRRALKKFERRALSLFLDLMGPS